MFAGVGVELVVSSDLCACCGFRCVRFSSGACELANWNQRIP